jgi:hypothetical protein
VTLAPKGLLIEEQRTNLVLRSEQFDNASWTATGVTISSNTATSPDGTVSADTMNEGTTISLHQTQQSGFTFTSGASYTQSVFAKADTATVIQMLFVSTAFGVNAFANYNLATGVLGTVGSGATATITAVGAGWYRITLTATATLTVAGTFGAFIFLCDNNTAAARAPLYTGSDKQLYLWGAQLEAGAFATSYIPTVASQVTRAADNASMIGNNFARWYNQTEGTICEYANFSGIRTTGTDYGLLINATLDDTIALGITDGNYLARVRVNSTDQALFGGASMTGGGSFSRAVAYKANDFATSLNGGTVSTDSSGAVPVGVSLLITSGFLGTSPVNRTISRISYYPRRLANTELQGITS